MVNTIDTPKPAEENQTDLNPPVSHFKSVRESKGLSLKDIYKITRISTTNLAAIENGDFHLLPPPVFTKSFIKIYANYLGVESTPILARYEQYLESMKSPSKEEEEKKPPARPPIHYRRLLWGSLILIVAVTVTLFLYWHKSAIEIQYDKPVQSALKTPMKNTVDTITTDVQKNIPDPAEIAKKTEVNIAQPTVDTPVQSSATEAASQSDVQQKEGAATQKIISMQKESSEKYPLILEAREVTWLRIRSDHDPPYEILLQPGEKVKKSASKFIIDVGNAGGIDIEFQGKSLGSLGKKGEVVHLTLP